MDTTLLLEHLDWVRALAHRLVRDQNVADDLVQEAWLAAERSAPVRPEAARGWFASVLRRKVSERHRLERNRRDRESQVAQREAVPSDADLVGKVEVETLLVQNVMELDEPVRRTVLLRYFEGLTPTQIASSEGVSVSTVKARLSKGREALRRKLDDQHGGDGREWILSLIPVAQAHAVKAKSAWGLAPLLAMAAVVAAAVVGTVALLQDDPAESVTPTDVEQVAGVEADVDEMALVEPDDAARSEAPDRVPVAATPGPERNETLTIRMVEDATGDPVPGGTTWVIDMDQMSDPEFEYVASARDLTLLCERFGQRVIADARGQADVAWSGIGAMVLSLDGAWFGSGEVDRRSEGEVELRMVPNWSLDVRVVDENGEAAPGVPIALTDSEGRTSIPAGSTDARGGAAISFFGGLIAERSDRKATKDYRLVCNYPGASELASAPIPLDEAGRPLETPVVLTLPPLGEVRFVAPDDLTSMRNVAVTLRPDDSDDDFMSMPKVTPPTLVDFGTKDEAVVACAIGQSYVAAWSVGGRPRRMVFEGPASVGQSIEVSLAADATPRADISHRFERPSPEADDDRVLRARLVDPDGNPLRGARHRMTVRSEGSSSGTTTTTDRDGGIDVNIGGLGRRGRGIEVEVELVDRAVGAHGSVEFTPHQLETLEEIGDIVLRPHEALVSGTVVGLDGEPLAGAAVAVQMELQSRDAPDGERARSWSTLSDVGGRSGRDGAFTLHSAPLSTMKFVDEGQTGRLRVRATKGRLQSQWVVATPGEPVEVAMVRTFDLALTFAEYDPDVLSDFSAHLATVGSKHYHRSRRDGAEHTWRKILPGRYDVELRHKQFQEPLHVISGVEVTSSGCDDPRLESFDLGALITTHTVEVLRHDGRPAEDVLVWVSRADGSSGASGHRTNAEGQVKVVSLPGEPRRVRVGEYDRDVDPTLLLEDMTFELPKPMTVQVRLVFERPLAAEDASLTVTARPTEKHSVLPVSAKGEPDEDGWMTYELKGVGPHRFDWALAVHMGRLRIPAGVAEPAANVDVTEDGQRIEIEVPEAVLEVVERDPRVRR